MTDMKGSRVRGLYRMSVSERIDVLQEQGWLDEASADALRDGRHLISPTAADKVIENVVGCFALPFAVAPNFIVNEQDYIVPLVVEAPDSPPRRGLHTAPADFMRIAMNPCWPGRSTSATSRTHDSLCSASRPSATSC